MSTHPHNPTSLIASASHSNTHPNSNNGSDTANQSTSFSSKLDSLSALQETLSTLTDSLGSILSPSTTEVHEQDRKSKVLHSSRVDETPAKRAGTSSRNLKAEVELESGGALGFF